eukprot:m.228621 g.228621  ORF g.228621 m.228621 type:complete len:124 (-) comp19250_c1_seq42:3438-3809(-)
MHLSCATVLCRTPRVCASRQQRGTGYVPPDPAFVPGAPQQLVTLTQQWPRQPLSAPMRCGEGQTDHASFCHQERRTVRCRDESERELCPRMCGACTSNATSTQVNVQRVSVGGSVFRVRFRPR